MPCFIFTGEFQGGGGAEICGVFAHMTPKTGVSIYCYIDEGG